MTPGRVYLDWNATAPLRAEAREATIAALDSIGNPSSVHGEGRAVRKIVERARDEVAALVGAKASEVVFTSGATESLSTVLCAGWASIVASGVEHDAVLAAARGSASRLIECPVSLDGVIDRDGFAAAVAAAGADGSALACVQLANNETGVIQPVRELAEIARGHNAAVLVDGAQGPGRVDVDCTRLGCDFLAISAHKFGGPKGVGALVIRNGRSLRPRVIGGGQEQRRRAGTENVPGIAGFGAAARMAKTELASGQRTMRALRDRFEARVQSLVPGAFVVASATDRLPNTTCLAIPGTRAETLLMRLDLAGIAVSSGSACSSGKIGASHVLIAMGLAPEVARSAVRISIGPTTREADIDRLLAELGAIAGSAAQRRAVA